MKDSGKLTLDDADFRILRVLSENGRASDVVIGERVHLSSSSVARRRRVMEESGVVVVSIELAS